MPSLIPFTPEHFACLASWFASEAEVVAWGGPDLGFPLREHQLEAMVAAGRSTPPRRLSWMLEEEGRLAGHAQLGLDWRNGNAGLSRVAVAPEARGRGLAGTLVRLVIEEAFGLSTGIERVELNVYSWNAAAIRTYDKVGFRMEGVRRSSARVGEERWDTCIMALLRAEWTAVAREGCRAARLT